MSVYIKWCAGFAAVMVFVLFCRGVSYRSRGFILKQYEEFTGMLKERQRDTTWHQRTEQKLIRLGAAYHYGKWINPPRYLLLRILCGVVSLPILCGVNLAVGVLVAGLLYFLPEWLLFYLNKKDNQRLLPEIKLIYHALEIQIKAGVYVADALAECYGSVREPRLRNALLDLAGQIVVKADLFEALDDLQRKFDNRQIDALCITLLQACESGRVVELLRDISEQLKDMEVAVMSAKKSSLDRSITFYQLGMLVAVLIVIVYACIDYLMMSAANL